MDNYRSLGNRSYIIIGREIDLQIKSNPKVREIRFVKIAELQWMYNSYVLKSADIPSIDGSDIIDAAPRKELADILNSKLKEGSLPQEIRVIKSKHRKDIWSIFFKQ